MTTPVATSCRRWYRVRNDAGLLCKNRQACGGHHDFITIDCHAVAYPECVAQALADAVGGSLADAGELDSAFQHLPTCSHA